MSGCRPKGESERERERMSEEWGRKEGGLRPGIPEDGSAQQNHSTGVL